MGFKPDVLFNCLRKLSAYDLFLVSLIILPLILNAWIGIIAKVTDSATARTWLTIAIMGLYLIGLLVMFFGQSREKRREVARDRIIAHLTAKHLEMMSFERVRERIDSEYSDAFLEGLITSFPRLLRRARLKGGKDGLARLIESDVSDEG